MIRKLIERTKLWIYKKYFRNYHYEYVRIEKERIYKEHHEVWDIAYRELSGERLDPLSRVRYDMHATGKECGLLDEEGNQVMTWGQIGKGKAAKMYNCSQFTSYFNKYKEPYEETV